MNNITFKVYPIQPGPGNKQIINSESQDIKAIPVQQQSEIKAPSSVEPDSCKKPCSPPCHTPCPPAAPVPTPAPVSPQVPYPPVLPTPEPPEMECPHMAPMPTPPIAPAPISPAPIAPAPIAPAPIAPVSPVMPYPYMPYEGCYSPMMPGCTPYQAPFAMTPAYPQYPQYPCMPTSPYYHTASRVAHAYVPTQFYNVVYSTNEALHRGTLFPELYQPQGMYGPCEGPTPCPPYFPVGGVPYGPR